jgi:murein DD-endopeptidase MepM/ murein hydrolase activator NlpD
MLIVSNLISGLGSIISPPVGTVGGGQYDIRYGSISIGTIDQILAKHPLYPLGSDGMPIPGSAPIGPNPLTPYAQQFEDFGQEYGLNPAYTLAQFTEESGICTTGISPSATECGNIIWTSDGGCATDVAVTGPDGVTRHFCGYSSWPNAIEAWFKLMTSVYLPQSLTTVPAIVKVYAPCSDNGGGNNSSCQWTNQYINTVEMLVDSWGASYIAPPTPIPGSGGNTNIPTGSPMPNAFITQPYGCTDVQFEPIINGCHFHQGIDLDYDSQPGHPEYATMSGLVVYAGIDPYTLSCGPKCGLGLMVKIASDDGQYILKYGHMLQPLVQTGDRVQPGQKVGVEGNTGASTAPHLHYQIELNGATIDPFPTLLGQNSQN